MAFLCSGVTTTVHSLTTETEAIAGNSAPAAGQSWLAGGQVAQGRRGGGLWILFKVVS